MHLIFHTRLVAQPNLAERRSEYLRAQRPAKRRLWKPLIVFGLAIFSYFAAGPSTSSAATLDAALVNEVPGGYADDASYEPSTSASGRFVAFSSLATNLSGSDGDGAKDVFVRDLSEQSIQLVSRANGIDGAGGQADSLQPSISASGRYVAFTSLWDGFSDADAVGYDVFVRDLKLGTLALVSRASGPDGEGGDASSHSPSISADGRFVAFESNADNLDSAAADTGNVFVRDLKRNRTFLVSRKSGRGKGGDSSSARPSISADGTRVAFHSSANNLSRKDENGFQNVFVRDVRTRKTMLVSRRTNGAGGNSDSVVPRISANGESVVFESYASNLDPVANDSEYDVFVHDIATGRTAAVSKNGKGIGANSDAEAASISGGGRFITYTSLATNLSRDDSDLYADVFVYDRKQERVKLASAAGSGEAADGASLAPSLSANGRFVAFESDAENLSDEDAQSFRDVFRVPLSTGPEA